MARAATSSDVFNAIAEARRREILDLLSAGELPVNELVARSGLAQPLVSKHLRVLRDVGLVEVRDEGRRRLYRVDAAALRPVHDWLAQYEQMWTQRFERLDAVLDDLKTSDDSREVEKDDGSGK